MKKTNRDGMLKTSERAQAAGLKCISRRHITQSGEVKLSDCKVRVTMYIDGDVLEYFKQRAARPNAVPDANQQ